MIKGNESDVGNIDIELQAYRSDKFLCFFIVFKTSKNVYISATRCPNVTGFGSKCGILNGQVINVENSKLNIAHM